MYVYDNLLFLLFFIILFLSNNLNLINVNKIKKEFLTNSRKICQNPIRDQGFLVKLNILKKYRILHLSILLYFLYVNYIHIRREREILVLFPLPNLNFAEERIHSFFFTIKSYVTKCYQSKNQIRRMDFYFDFYKLNNYLFYTQKKREMIFFYYIYIFLIFIKALLG